MKNIIVFALLAFSNFIFSQNDNFDISVTSALIDPIIGGGAISYGPDGGPKDKLVTLYVTVKIDGFDEKNPINFNYFSLVEVKNNLRHRPHYVSFRYFALTKFNIEEPAANDDFLKYTQTGVENYDHFYYDHTAAFKKDTNSKQRFYLLCIPVKKNKKKKFELSFPIKVRKEGDFILYYKDQEIKAFSASKINRKF